MPNEIPLTIEQLRFEMEQKGWVYSKVERNGKTYIRFEIGEHADWTLTPLFELYYTEAFGEPELRLRKGLSQWSLLTISYPPLPSEMVEVFKACSRHA